MNDSSAVASFGIDRFQPSEAANRAKDLFLATLSHEMRTALNAIVGWLSILPTIALKRDTFRRG